ncbi:trifunctional transcriptional regulator/proline dehydrogenase/L-glutamate gamma-semialdehyde dehydrogenase [Chthonobacter rhizosphaerae]|uniref:trifunctional transcriptional regulator/proline dehydrogenase/L-glutamate gamma-semialdehyde dehydrogenase n=1 Tax=Chthonobacter rhizosphaerae TaxID=2735553 RepID=UPI0015EF8EC1|nr:trifunctional transcriptional regulator/proline dehydrogenase/L-glutamate gamma-semialdehyde dehydrogenase [Chthonobacter rhizosphaerae]
MAATTIGVKVNDDLRARLKLAADRIGRSPHWLVKHALLSVLERIERGETVAFEADDAAPVDLVENGEADPSHPRPFLEFAQGVQPQSVLRAKITAAYRRPETECLPLLLSEATLPPAVVERARALARDLVTALRDKKRNGGSAVEGLIQEYSLSSQEGVALMCLAEALLRIPDRPTRDALIRDKIANGDWHAHVGHSPSLFVNAATWGLVVTGKLTATSSEQGLSSALTRLIGRSGEPVIRKGVDIAMRMMGEQFVTGQTIGEALANSRRMEAKGFRYSYDMLGEAATTAEDAARYYRDYEQAIHAIGKAAGRRGIYEGPGISVKLSALHPRYSRAQSERVMGELLPRLKSLAVLARSYDIGLNIDAEEADRLEISLDLLEALCFDPDLKGWNGIGFVVQAYQKRCPFVIDFVVDLARRSGHRLMIRLVKGAYWDSEIKRAQVEGLEGFPVFTRKVHTDVSYLASARKLLAAPDAVFPQFATHNAQTLATIMAMAGENFYAGQYEFQCLHGMGEPLYEEVVGKDKLNRPCRIYAPVGTHETLLAYLVRRLLENGANTSFVNRIADETVPIDDLIKDPVAEAKAIQPVGARHPKIAHPREIFGDVRPNSLGLDLSNEQRLASLSAALLTSADMAWTAAPMIGDRIVDGDAQAVRNPADNRDVVGRVVLATPADVDAAFAEALAAAPIWAATPPAERADALARAADLMEARMPTLIGIVVREAGKSIPNAVAEVREAVDFLRYYGAEVRAGFAADTHRPLGPVVCISPWNFPLAIFTGQVAAALAAGNPVLAKPAEETPLIAAEAIRILREAGVPGGAVQLLTGAGDVGAALVADRRVRGVMFTGSTEVARLIQKTLADRLTPDGHPIPLIAETGGQNALVVDSSALAEQVVGDVIASAYDSAGQRCSALRVLCLQEDVADRVLAMLRGALRELSVGNPDRLSTDVGPVITAEARDGILAHVAAMRQKGFAVEELPLPPATRHGTFVPPTLIEIRSVADLGREVFGPVLHVLRYRRDDLDALIDQINATGYGLTFGLHTRLDETIARVVRRAGAGNVYVNRNVIGAVVGVQPFGGHGLSGTGPKAGGPLYLGRLVARRPAARPVDAKADAALVAPAEAFRDWLSRSGRPAVADRVAGYIARTAVGAAEDLPGPVGERNVYALKPRGPVFADARTEAGALIQIGAALAAGDPVLIAPDSPAASLLEDLPRPVADRIRVAADALDRPDLAAVLFEGDADALQALAARVAAREGAIVPVQGASPHALADGTDDWDLDLLVSEVSISTNTAAAGGNASLMTIG